MRLSENEIHALIMIARSVEPVYPSDLQDQLGHASLATTGIYLKVSPNHRREAYMRSKRPVFLAGETP